MKTLLFFLALGSLGRVASAVGWIPQTCTDFCLSSHLCPNARDVMNRFLKHDSIGCKLCVTRRCSSHHVMTQYSNCVLESRLSCSNCHLTNEEILVAIECERCERRCANQQDSLLNNQGQQSTLAPPSRQTDPFVAESAEPSPTSNSGESCQQLCRSVKMCRDEEAQDAMPSQECILCTALACRNVAARNDSSFANCILGARDSCAECQNQLPTMSCDSCVADCMQKKFSTTTRPPQTPPGGISGANNPAPHRNFRTNNIQQPSNTKDQTSAFRANTVSQRLRYLFIIRFLRRRN
ncbi:uncharacterized protein LOC143461588 [Clavelina lepadiformis]|uniref:uncharacterized protein LOC143461588 n=1 Tax=Clavelina lepadiformis TaxID=159417 RepID=UPI0040419C16